MPNFLEPYEIKFRFVTGEAYPLAAAEVKLASGRWLPVGYFHREPEQPVTVEYCHRVPIPLVAEVFHQFGLWNWGKPRR